MDLINKYKSQIPEDVQINLTGQDRKYEPLPDNINTSAPLPFVNELTAEDVKGKFGKMNISDVSPSEVHSIIEENKVILNEEDDAVVK